MISTFWMYECISFILNLAWYCRSADFVLVVSSHAVHLAQYGIILTADTAITLCGQVTID